MTYQVLHGRFDIQTRVYTTFQAISDKEARKQFEERYVPDPTLEWDALILRRVTKTGKATSIASVRIK